MKNVIKTAGLIIFGLIAGFLAKDWLELNQDQNKDIDQLANTSCATDGAALIFSCAMHPSLESEEPGACPVCGMKLVDRLSSPYFNPELIPLEPGQVRQLNIRTAAVRNEGNLQKEIRLTGKLELDESKVFHQICHLPGRLEKLYISKVGDYVKKGQAIASVYSKELVAALETYHYNKRSESLARSALNNLAAWKVPAKFYESVDMTKDYHLAVDVYADFSGVVTDMKASPGSYALNTHMGHPTVLYEVADLSQLWAILDVYERDLNWVKTGATVSLEFPAFPGQKWEGKVDYIGDQVDPVSQTIPVRVVISNRNRKLKPGMITEANLVYEMPEAEVLFVPESAVLWTGKRSVVYIKDADFEQAVFSLREIEIGRNMDGQVEVLHGLREGEMVVVQGAFQLDASAQIQGRQNMMDYLNSNPESLDNRIANQ